MHSEITNNINYVTWTLRETRAEEKGQCLSLVGNRIIQKYIGMRSMKFAWCSAFSEGSYVGAK